MPETYGKLDGLREIIPPAMPVQEFDLPWLLLLACVGALLLLLAMYIRYRQRPLTRARRQYRKLSRPGSRLDAVRYGDAITAILRMYSGTHNLQGASITGIDKQAWLALIDDCNRLRFSGVHSCPDVIEQAMNKTEKLLWSTH
jgi:hypothetical protein